MTNTWPIQAHICVQKFEEERTDSEALLAAIENKQNLHSKNQNQSTIPAPPILGAGGVKDYHKKTLKRQTERLQQTLKF